MKVDDEEIRSMLRSRSGRADARGLRESVQTAVRTIPQVHRVRPLTSARSSRPIRLTFAIGAVAAVVALVVLTMARLPLGVVGPGVVGTASIESSQSTNPSGATDAPALGRCQVTPVGSGGKPSEVRTSGVVWHWGESAWTARVKQGVTLTVEGKTKQDATEILAVRIPTSAFPSTLEVTYPRGSGNDQSFQIGLPEPGCWLLAALGPTTHSSVVIEANQAPTTVADPVSQHIPTSTQAASPASVCPTSPTRPNTPGTSLDGTMVWYTHPESWLIGEEDKLVIGAEILVEQVVAAPVVGAQSSPVFVAAQPSVTTPAPGSGNISMGFVLPSTGCYMFAAMGPTSTSTVVADIRR